MAELSLREESVKKFLEAGYGLFIHYGLYSMLARGEWVMFHEKIHVDEYSKLKDKFTAEGFNAEKIADMTVDAGMKYINITTRHHDGFCLWNTKHSDFNSVNSPAKRDLVEELANACAKRGLKLFLYYSHGRDWRHPYFPPNEVLDGNARPHYDEPEPAYKWTKESDTDIYLQFMHDQLEELLKNYGPIGGIWFDGRITCKARPDLFKLSETYAHIRKLQPGTLVSYKGGVTGDEDFIAPERAVIEGRDMAGKPGEICDTINKNLWGYNEGEQDRKTAEEIAELVRNARAVNCNLLLNTGPVGDGSIHPDEEKALLGAGKILRG